MENPYETTNHELLVTRSSHHVQPHVFAGLLLSSVTASSLALALYVLNQNLQIIPTKTQFYLTVVNGIPVSNNSVVVALLAVTGFFGAISAGLFAIGLRNARRNSLLPASGSSTYFGSKDEDSDSIEVVPHGKP